MSLVRANPQALPRPHTRATQATNAPVPTVASFCLILSLYARCVSDSPARLLTPISSASSSSSSKPWSRPSAWVWIKAGGNTREVKGKAGHMVGPCPCTYTRTRAECRPLPLPTTRKWTRAHAHASHVHTRSGPMVWGHPGDAPNTSHVASCRRLDKRHALSQYTGCGHVATSPRQPVDASLIVEMPSSHAIQALRPLVLEYLACVSWEPVY